MHGRDGAESQSPAIAGGGYASQTRVTMKGMGTLDGTGMGMFYL